MTRPMVEKLEQAERDLESFLQTLEVRAEDNRFLRKENQGLREALNDLLFQVCAAQREREMGICTEQAEQALKEVNYG